MTFDFNGIPVYFNPLIGEDRIQIVNKDTPQVYFVVDKMETLEKIVEYLNQGDRHHVR